MCGCSGAAISGAIGQATRARNAAATRQAILDAAQACFMRDGYEHVGVREIAGRAGVDPALVNRYFGSKEGLFAEAVAAKFDLTALLTGDRATLGERLARFVLMKKQHAGQQYDPLVALLRSTSCEAPAKMLRQVLVDGWVRPLAAYIDGPDALQRAELVSSTLLGLLVHRTVIGGTVAAESEQLVSLVGPTLQALIDCGAPTADCPNNT
jgi:AcrR family transcriptional regulator